ncbi:MAG: alcohol dehydrogenase catalytic domain-containing protein [Conexivisphaerales archaeon]
MKAILVKKGSGAALADVEIPEISEGEVLVKMKVCGLCGTDIEKIRGEYVASMPIVGHEPAGVVAGKGVGVEGLEIGDRVFVHHHVPCGECFYCKHGSETMCPSYRSSNIFPGGFAEYFRVPKWNVQHGAILKLPDGVSFEEGSLIEPLACCIRAINRWNIEGSDSVLVVGAGPLGLMHALLLMIRGIKPIVSDIKPSRLEMARKLGVSYTLDANNDVEQQVKSMTDGRGVDYAITASGSISAMNQALRAIRKGGKLCLFGVPSKGSVLDYDISEIFNSEISILTNYGATEKETNEALRLIERNGKLFSSIITHRYSIDEFSKAVEASISGEALKVVIYSS